MQYSHSLLGSRRIDDKVRSVEETLREADTK